MNLAILCKTTPAPPLQPDQMQDHRNNQNQYQTQDQVQHLAQAHGGGGNGGEEEAVLLYTECYETRASTLGVHHPDTLGTLVGLVDCHQRTGTVTALKRALALLQKHAQESQSQSQSSAHSEGNDNDNDDNNDDDDNDIDGDGNAAVIDDGLVSVLTARMEEIKRDLLVLTLDVVETQAV